MKQNTSVVAPLEYHFEFTIALITVTA